MSWREALPEPPGLAGSVVLNTRNESEEVKDIVENVTRLVDMTDLYVADNPVGVKSRIPDIQSNDMIPLVLWGAWAELSSARFRIKTFLEVSYGNKLPSHHILEEKILQIWQCICRPVWQVAGSPPPTINNVLILLSVIDNLRDTNASMWKIYLLYIFIFEEYVCEWVWWFFPDDSYADWLTFSSKGSSVLFEVPQVVERNLKAMMSIVYTSTPNNITLDDATIQLVNRGINNLLRRRGGDASSIKYRIR